MNDADTLLALAEIAAAFAGFAALVSVIQRGAQQPGQALHDLLRLRLVISSSVAGVAAALIPIGFAGYGLDPALSWRLSAAMFLLLGNGIIASLVRSYRPVSTEFEPDRLAVVVVTTIEVIEQASLVIVLFGLPFGNPAALYLTALIGNICQTGFVFVRFVGSTFRRQVSGQ